MRKFNQSDNSSSKKTKLFDSNVVKNDSEEAALSYMTRSNSKLFDALENFNKLGCKRKCENFVIFESDEKLTYSVRYDKHKKDIASQSQTIKEVSKVQTSSNSSGSKKRHTISGTGRVAYSGKAIETGTKENIIEDESIRMIYRMMKGGKAPEDSMQWSEFTLGSSTASDSVKMMVDGAISCAMTGVIEASITTNLTGSFTSLTVSSSAASIAPPPVAVNKFTGKPIVGKGGGGSSISNMFKKSAAANGGGGVNAQRTPSNVFNKAPNSSSMSAGSGSQQLGVGVGGRAAAMARMAVLGEEWPEEEELPGAFSAASTNVTTSGSAATAGVSREVGKEVHNAHQRTQKIKAAKRG